MVLIQATINGGRVGGGGIGNDFLAVPGYPKQSSAHGDFPFLLSVKFAVTITCESNLIALSKQSTVYQPNQCNLPLKFPGAYHI